MKFDRTFLAQAAAASLVTMILLIGGAFIGSTIWPRVVKVEQRVVAPAINAAAFTPAVERWPDLVGQACPAIVAIEQDGPAPDISGTTPPARGRKKATVVPSSANAVHRTTGFLVSNDGYIVTNASALSEQGAIRVLLNDGRTFDAARTGADPVSGLAMLKAGATGLPFLKFAGPGFPRVGEWVIAVSSPGGHGCTATVGIVSADSLAEQETLRTFVRIRPSLDAGMAGAPLLNADGDVLGIAGLGSKAGEDDQASTVLPADIAGRIVSAMLRSGASASNRFGIVADDLVPVLAARIGADRQRGAVVSLIDAGSPADKGGLRAGDLILAVSASPISGASELARALDTKADAISLDVQRGSKRLTVSLAAPDGDN
ncbi:MAG: trypsin-like peptidase domain-containing protein [Sphingomonas sp.]